MYKTNDCNGVCVAGTVSKAPEFDHILYGERFYSLSLSVPRLSGTADILPLTVSDRVCLKLPRIGDKIRVFGQMRSYNKRTESGSKLVITVFSHVLEPMSELDEPQNEVELTGYLCKEAIFRTTPFLREICDILIAVNRSYNKSDYLPCIAWGRNAQFAKGLPVGRKAASDGEAAKPRIPENLSRRRERNEDGV